MFFATVSQYKNEHLAKENKSKSLAKRSSMLSSQIEEYYTRRKQECACLYSPV